jgi:hypothetical protein
LILNYFNCKSDIKNIKRLFNIIFNNKFYIMGKCFSKNKVYAPDKIYETNCPIKHDDEI